MAKAKDFFNTAGGFVNGMVSGFMPSAPRDGAAAQEIVNTPGPFKDVIKDPTETLKSDPLSFTHMRYPLEVGNEELGHYIIFYTLSNNFGHLGRDFEIAKDMGWSASATGSVKQTTEVGGPRNEYSSTSTTNDTQGTINLERLPSTPQAKLTNHSLLAQAPNDQKVTSAIALYMPPAITVSYKNGYEVEAAEVSGDILQTASKMKAADTRMKSLEAFLQGFTASAGAYMKTIGGSALDAVGGGDIFKLSTKAIGIAVNPRNEQYYTSPGFRSFSYTFDFYPKNKEEADTVHNIITMFKYHSHPELIEGNLSGRFFVAPSEFEIHYMYKDKVNEKMNRISRCVCTDVDVKYGPDEQFSTFDDGHPVTTNLTLNFTELEFMTKEKIFPGSGIHGA